MYKSDDQVFFEALEFDSPAAQDAHVRSVCMDDPEQCQRVLELLATYRQMHMQEQESVDVLSRPAEIIGELFAAERLAVGGELQPGDRIGHYRIEEKLGMGGVGVVYLATQSTPIDRQVALKALKPGMDSIKILGRFELERRVLAQLDHPGITKILDAGMQENGHPFYAMELVRDPVPITAYCEEFNLSVHARVELLIDVCEIVQYAHQRGVIHRDLKPSNLLVERCSGTKPRLKVIDFGIAKIIDGTNETSDPLTVAGERFGTPAYMSPEQAENCFDVDTRSDIYSIGVVMFEMLTGQTPYSIARSRTQVESLKRFGPDFIPRPSEWLGDTSNEHRITPSHKQVSGKQLRGDLDAIVQKALAVDRVHRYQSVRELQQDLRCYLCGMPVQAIGPTLFYQLKKRILRHRVAALGVVFFLVAMIGSTVVSTNYAIRAGRAETELRQKLDESLTLQARIIQERDKAEAAKERAFGIMRFNQFSMAIDEALVRLTKRVLESNAIPSFSELRTLVEPHPRLVAPGDWSWARHDHLHDLLSVASDTSSQEIARMVSYESQNVDSKSSLRPIEETCMDYNQILLATLAKLVPGDDPLIAEVLDNVSLYEQDVGKLAEAERHLEEACTIWKRFPRHAPKLIQSQLFLADTLLRQNKIEQAVELLQKTGTTLAEMPPDSLKGPLRALHLKLVLEAQTELY